MKPNFFSMACSGKEDDKNWFYGLKKVENYLLNFFLMQCKTPQTTFKNISNNFSTHELCMFCVHASLNFNHSLLLLLSLKLLSIGALLAFSIDCFGKTFFEKKRVSKQALRVLFTTSFTRLEAYIDDKSSK